LTATSVDALIGEQVRVRIRARDVSIALERPQRISIQNVLGGKISEIGRERNGIVDISIGIGATTLAIQDHRAGGQGFADMIGVRLTTVFHICAAKPGQIAFAL